MNNTLFLLGGGASVRYCNGIRQGLLHFLEDKFCFGLNFAYKFMNPTCTVGIDAAMYEAGNRYSDELHDEIGRLPLVIWNDSKDVKRHQDNTIFLKCNKKYDRDLTDGVYGNMGCGIFALSLGIYLLKDLPNPRIYMLGFDYGSMKDEQGKPLVDYEGKQITHWYQKNYRHRGTGLVSWYNQTKIDPTTKQRKPCWYREYQPLRHEKHVKIYNVSPVSNIEFFEKISYEEMFSHQFDTVMEQSKLRDELKIKLLNLKNERNI